MLRLCPSGRRKTNLLVPVYLLFCNPPGAVITLVLIARPTLCVPRQVQDSFRAPATVNVLTPTLNRVRHSKHLHIHCLRSTAPALAMACSPMLMVTRWPLIRFAATEQVCALLTMCCMRTDLM